MMVSHTSVPTRFDGRKDNGTWWEEMGPIEPVPSIVGMLHFFIACFPQTSSVTQACSLNLPLGQLPS